MYECFGQYRAALFNLADALLTETQAHSVIELTLSPLFERKWSSLYAALHLGKLNQARFEQTLLKFAPTPAPGQRLVTAVDASNIERPFSETSRDRGYLYVHNLPECDAPVTVGWQFSTVVVVPAQASSHTYILSNRRIPTAQTPAQVAAAQLKELRPYFEERPINLGDRYYPTKDFLVEVSPDYDLLMRLKANRVFYRPAPVVAAGSGKRGAPTKHGPRFQCKAADTHTQADREWAGLDEGGARLEVSEWQDLHLREAVELSLSVIRVRRYGASRKRRDPYESWFVWAGQSELELKEVWATYKRRYSIENSNTQKRISVEFYQTPSGKQPVREWLREELSLEDRKIVGKDLLKIELEHPVDMPLCKYLGKGLWECRSNLTFGKIARVIFCVDGSRMIALVGFIKKSQRDQHQIELALKRKREIGL